MDAISRFDLWQNYTHTENVCCRNIKVCHFFFFTYSHTYIKFTLTEKHTPTTEAYQNTREPKKERSPPKSNGHYKKKAATRSISSKNWNLYIE